jgi:hypothetical protein
MTKHFISKPARYDTLMVSFAVIAHVIMGILYRVTVEWINPQTWPWADTIQALPMQDLQTNLVESLYYLHAQPPLFNLWGGVMGQIFPSDYLEIMCWQQMLMGAAITVFAYFIGCHVLRSRWLSALIVIPTVALNPNIITYEQMIFYTLPTTFLLTTSVVCIQRFTTTQRPRYLYGFIVCLNLVVLLRSMYHLVIFLLPMLIFAIILAGPRWRRMAMVIVLITLPAVGWHVKNAVEFGFFGATSWSGMNLWKIAQEGHSNAELNDLVQAGKLDPVIVQLSPFSSPSAYAAFGFTDTSDIAVLSHDDLNNINIVAISELYGRNARTLIQHDPGQYIRNARIGYTSYTSPSYKTIYHLMPRGFRWHMRISMNLTYGYELITHLNKWTGGSFPTMLGMVLPLVLIGYFFSLVKQGWQARQKWLDVIRADAVMVICAILILYSTMVGSAFELGENYRFKIDIEPILWVFIAAVIWRGLTALCFKLLRRSF